MLTRAPNYAHGLVRPWEQGRSFALDSRPPSVALERLVDRFWIASMRALPPDVRVQEIAAANHLAPRTLQLLFRRYVGVSPQVGAQGLRIHEACERLAAATPPGWTTLALDLGYYDHAHFIRDFGLVVGRSPAQYVREAAAARRPAREKSTRSQRFMLAGTR
jgi:transcriptional regulator GlxA family with amidase domain